MRFKDKVAIVTGAAQGIGKTYAQRLAGEGAHVIVADINSEKGEAVAHAIRADGGAAQFIGVDVADEASCLALAAAVRQEFGHAHYLLNNAAIFAGMKTELLMTVDMAYFDKIMRVNFTSVLLVTRAIVPLMVAAGGGAIVNQSSTAAYSLRPLAGYYSISKLAVNGLTIALAHELGPMNIRVNGVAPGLTATEAMAGVVGSAGTSALVENQALKRLGTTEDQASAALFLLSPEAAFITGQTLCVDGGMTRRI